MIVRTDRILRADLVEQARLIAQTLDVERIHTLSGSEADLTNTNYLRLKEQLAIVRAASPQCRFVYLLGRKPDDTLFFFVDSEPAGSADCSPPGQTYTEAPPSLRRVISTRTAGCVGPETDRWGTWISALVPIIDPQTTMYGLATPNDAHALVKKALAYYHQNGRKKLIETVNTPNGEFHKGDLYVIVYDRSMTWLAHPAKPSLVGQNWIDKKDWSEGKYFRREIQSVVQSKGHGWVEYEHDNPLNGQRDHKTSYVEGVDDLIICSGVFKGKGELAAVLGMDVDASAWNTLLARAAMPSVLFTLALTFILITGAMLSARLRCSRHCLQRVASTQVVAIGLCITAFVFYLVHENEAQTRLDAFAHLAKSRTADVAQNLRTIGNTELQSFARFCEIHETITAEALQDFTAFLPTNPAISGWAWVPVVPAAERPTFEAAENAKGGANFEIWEKNSAGDRCPASPRDRYYPMLRVVPLVENEVASGFDLGSEPQSRAALEEAGRSGQCTGSDPVTLVEKSGSPTGFLVFQPVYGGDEGHRLRGFALAVTRIVPLLGNSNPDDLSLLELSLLHTDQPPKPLATTWASDSPPSAETSFTRPVFAWGKVFSVNARASQEFNITYHAWAPWLAMVLGLALTASLGTIVHISLRRREELERLVVERTRDLQESEQAQRNQFAANSSVMLLIDPSDGTIIDANAAALRFYGHPREKLLALRMSNINTLPEDQILQAMGSVAENQGKRFEFRHRLADGSIRDVAVSLSRIQFGKRSILHSIVHDITERKQAEDDLKLVSNRLSLATRAGGVGIWDYDVVNNRLAWDAQMFRLYGTSPQRFNGAYEDWQLAVHPEDRVSTDATIQSALRGEQEFATEFRVLWPDGDIRSIRALAIVQRDAAGKPIRMIGTNWDITPQKQAEATLRDSENRFREAAAMAERANAIKSEFLANMSHELRTPLNAVVGITNLLLDTSIDDTQRNYLEIVQNGGASLLTLINDILDFSKIEAQKLELESAEFDLPELLGDFSVAPARKAAEQGLKFTLTVNANVPTWIKGDSRRLKQILTNLTGNALKFTARGEVTVTAACLETTRTYSTLRFAVRDTGIGIPADKQALLFQKFSQVDGSSTRKFGGTGLGLVIAQKLAGMMGGEIGVTSQENHGSEFWFTVRLEKAASRESTAKPYSEDRTRNNDSGFNPRILLVEDVPTNRVVAVAILKKLGCSSIDTAVDGLDALNALKKSPYDLVFMDIQMPVMDGHEATRQIRAPGSTVLNPKVPVVAITAHALPGDREKCIDAGMNDYVKKPVTQKALSEMLGKWLPTPVNTASPVPVATVSVTNPEA